MQLIFNWAICSFICPQSKLLPLLTLSILFLAIDITSFNLTLITADNLTVPMFLDGKYQSQFVEISEKFNCSLSPIYTYEQNKSQNQANTPYYLDFSGLNSSITFTLKTIHGIFTPNLSTNTCNGDCMVEVQNNCPKQVTQFAYFDLLQLDIQGMPTPFTYNVLCDNSFSTNTFEWGLVIMIIVCTLGLTLLTVYSKAWSFGGSGIKVTYWLVLAFWAVLALGGILAQTTEGVIDPILQVCCLLLGVAGVLICSNQALFLLKLTFLERGFWVGKLFQIRVLDFVSLLIGIGLAVGYFYSNKNWIVNNIICGSIIIGVVKIMKFTDLKIAIFSLCVTLAVEMTFVLVIHYTQGTSYNDLILNQYNYPFELQLPTINPVYHQKCAWFPCTAIIYPGIFMSYLRRFDLSRNTNIYLITALVVFVAGSLVWMFISIGSVHSWPFQIVTGPTMLVLVALFAYKRREIRTLWEGSFYDQDFADRKALNQIQVSVDESKQTELIRASMFNNLTLNRREDSDLTSVRAFSGLKSQN